MRKVEQVERKTGMNIIDFLKQEYVTNKKSTHQNDKVFSGQVEDQA